MKALVYQGPEQLAYQEVPEPSPAIDAGEVLIRIDSVGICGSDMHAFLGHDERRPAPLILGHEAAGHIVGGDRDGERVTINPLVTCGSCEPCKAGRNNLCADRQIISMPPREGAFAQFVSMPQENLTTVPDGVSLEHASLAEPIACGWHAVRLGKRVMHPELAVAKCLVLGGGAIGMGAALSLRAQGAEDITIAETNPLRHPALNSEKDFTVVNPLEIELQASSFDFVIDAVGFAATRRTACQLIKPGGVIAHIGLGDANDGLDIRRMTLQEITFIGTYTYTPSDFVETANAIFDGSMGRLDWIEVQPLEKGQWAFDEIRAGRAVAPKIVLKPWV